MTINIKGNLLNFSTPKIMGILNVTPDSFFDGGKTTSAATKTKTWRNASKEGAILEKGASVSGNKIIKLMRWIYQQVPRGRKALQSEKGNGSIRMKAL